MSGDLTLVVNHNLKPALNAVKNTFLFEKIGKENSGPIGDAIGDAIGLTERQNEIIKLIKGNPKISYRKAAESLKINYSAAQARFDALKNKGIIRREGEPEVIGKYL